MISYLTYRLVHLFGVLGLVVAAAALSSRVEPSDAWKKPLLVWVTLGTLSLVVLTGGFGMLARLDRLNAGVPGWAQLKIAILAAMMLIAVAPKRRAWARQAALGAIPLLGLLAAIIALFKPF